MKSAVLVILVLLSVVASPSMSYGQCCDGCPPCFNNQLPLPGRRTLSDGRRVLNVAIKVGAGSDSWGVNGGTTTDPTMAEATGGGIGLWNNARDLGASTGRTTAMYAFDSPTNITLAETDILIVKDSSSDPRPAWMDTTSGPHSSFIFVQTWYTGWI